MSLIHNNLYKCTLVQSVSFVIWLLSNLFSPITQGHTTWVFDIYNFKDSTLFHYCLLLSKVIYLSEALHHQGKLLPQELMWQIIQQCQYQLRQLVVWKDSAMSVYRTTRENCRTTSRIMQCLDLFHHRQEFLTRGGGNGQFTSETPAVRNEIKIERNVQVFFHFIANKKCMHNFSRKKNQLMCFLSLSSGTLTSFQISQ